ncbi:MAG TPA: TIGR03560 family F420-dependent LLM class oxidoreductase [Capillimicrobium sp.]|nr:TIGR03560 family F420-dependent LLM class oxidoreductase [Capillimicrobium sp.]
MELCVMIEGQEGETWEQWRAIAAACEEHGIPALFRSDHYLPLDGHLERGALDAWTTIAALAAITTNLRLGTLVSPATFRHPSVLAKSVVTADHVSGGRVELGLGAGWHLGEHKAYGFPFAGVAERFDVLAEQIEIVHSLWGDAAFEYHGRHYRLMGVDARPKPVQRPHPPLIVGGNAKPRSAALAARFADEYNTVFATPAECCRRRAAVARAWAEAGRDPTTMRFSLMTGCIVGRRREDVRARLQRLEAEHGMEPAESWVVGTFDTAGAHLRALREAGVDRVMLQLLLHDDLEQIAFIGDELPAALERV